MRALKYIPAVALILFGASLEIFWYHYRFIGDGVDSIVAWLAGIVLTLFLIVLTKLKKTPANIMLTALLISYSIFCTSAGQAYDLEQKRMSQEESRSQQSDAERERDRIRQTIDSLNSRFDLIESQKNEQITSLEDRFLWRNTLARAEEDQKDIQNQIAVYRSELSSLYNNYEVTPPDIYNYYGGLFGWSPIWLQTILQMMLSMFIALMAPVGVSIWPKVKMKSTPRKKQVIEKLDPSMVERWIEINWIGVRRNSSNKILAKKTFEEFIANREENFSTKSYNQILDAAKKSGLISEGDFITEIDEKKALHMIMSVDK